METLEQVALRMWKEIAWLDTPEPAQILDFARRLVEELGKQEPWGWALPADRDYTIRQVTRVEPSPSGIATPLYLHPALETEDEIERMRRQT